MALAPVLAAALTDHSARKFGLYIDGLDVSKAPGTAGNSYGVDPASITVREAGAGQVSDMTFTITDPQAVVAVADGQMVRFHDFTRDMPVFLGWIEDWSARALGGGRAIDVKCVGIETILDWAYVPTAITVSAAAAGASGVEGYHGAMCAVVANAVGLDYPANTRWISTGGAGGSNTREYPFRGIVTGFSATTFTVGPGSLRQCLMQLFDLINNETADVLGAAYDATTRWFLTVDFYGGIRATYQTIDPVNGMTDVKPVDYGAVTLDTSTPPRPSGTRYGVTGTAVGGVYVKGAGAGARYVKRSGGIGRVATTGTTSVTTSDGARAVADSYFARNGSVRNGSAAAEGTVTMGTDAAQVRVGARITVVDPQVGLASPGFNGVIVGIEKTWSSSGEETWAFQFGGQDPAIASSYLRALTRDERV